MSGFKDKRLKAIWEGLGLPAEIDKQERFEREIYEWSDSMDSIEIRLRRYMSSFDCESMKGFDCTGIDCIKCPFKSGNAARFAIAWTREITEGGQ